jgi:hypothetical protein
LTDPSEILIQWSLAQNKVSDWSCDFSSNKRSKWAKNGQLELAAVALYHYLNMHHALVLFLVDRQKNSNDSTNIYV